MHLLGECTCSNLGCTTKKGITIDSNGIMPTSTFDFANGSALPIIFALQAELLQLVFDLCNIHNLQKGPGTAEVLVQKVPHDALRGGVKAEGCELSGIVLSSMENEPFVAGVNPKSRQSTNGSIRLSSHRIVRFVPVDSARETCDDIYDGTTPAVKQHPTSPKIADMQQPGSLTATSANANIASKGVAVSMGRSSTVTEARSQPVACSSRPHMQRSTKSQKLRERRGFGTRFTQLQAKLSSLCAGTAVVPSVDTRVSSKNANQSHQSGGRFHRAMDSKTVHRCDSMQSIVQSMPQHVQLYPSMSV